MTAGHCPTCTCPEPVFPLWEMNTKIDGPRWTVTVDKTVRRPTGTLHKRRVFEKKGVDRNDNRQRAAVEKAEEAARFLLEGIE